MNTASQKRNKEAEFSTYTGKPPFEKWRQNNTVDGGKMCREKCQVRFRIRKDLLVERETLLRELAFAKFQKSTRKGGESVPKVKALDNGASSEVELERRLVDVTKCLKREFKLRELVNNANKPRKSIAATSLDSFLVKGIAVQLYNKSILAMDDKFEEKYFDRNGETILKCETPLAELLPPLQLPPIHTQSFLTLKKRRQLQLKETVETEYSFENVWETLLDCRYLRTYKPKRETAFC